MAAEQPINDADRPEAPREEQKKRLERANRILDAAAELLLRWGYKKTTIDDIAKQAAVAKGTIYLHWKTREDLFLALITRERLREGEMYLDYTRHHPQMATLSGLTYYSILLMENNPLLKAVFLQDTDILGTLLRTANYGHKDIQERIQVSEKYIGYLRDKGLIRSDIDIKTEIYMFSAILMGFLLIDRYLPEEYRFTNEERAEKAAEAVRRAFELRTPDVAELHATTDQFSDAINALYEIEKRDLEL